MSDYPLMTRPHGQQTLDRYRPTKTINIGLLIILVFIGGFTLWAVLAPLNASVQAPGEVTFDTKRKTVQHLEGGIVKQILVREGDTVIAGQPLIILDDAQVKPTVDLLEGQSLAEIATAARLEAEKSEQRTISFPSAITSRAGDPVVASIIRAETKLFNAKRAAYQSQVEVLQSQLQQTREDIGGQKRQLEEKKKEIASLSEQLSAGRMLLKDGYFTRTAVLDLERVLAEKNGELTAINAAIARNTERLSELNVRIAGIKSGRIQDAMTEMKQSTVKRLELEERVRPSRNALERGVIRAPVSGKVVDLKVTTVGGVIAGKEPLMDIVPSSEHLMLEAKIGINDIQDVRPGLPAEVTLTAYKASSTPKVKATVTQVSADRLTIKALSGEQPYYAVKLAFDQKSLSDAGNLQLYPGMGAQVAITTEARTALDYFIGPLKQRLGKAFHEK
jgi:HlyD family type I secretion membrane fusion protein